MGLFVPSIEKRAWSELDDRWYYPLWSHLKTDSGVKISEHSALAISAVFACINAISQDVGKLPLHFYKRKASDNREKATEHSLYKVLMYRPNPEMSAIEFKQVLTGHVLGWGTAYAEIEFNGAGQVIGLWPLPPDRTKPKRTEGGTLYYAYRSPSGEEIPISAERIFRLHGLGFNGISGYSVIGLAREGIGLAKATETFAAKYFGNGAISPLLLTHPGKLGEDAVERMRSSWEKAHGGLNNAHRVAILQEGVTVEKIGIPPNDSQFLESREFSVPEIARFFRMPLHKIQHLKEATFNNIEHLAQEYLSDTLEFWLKSWEQQVYNSLLTEKEQKKYYAEFLTDSILRGDTETRYEAYAKAIQNGFMSPDDVRRKENMNPLPDGSGKQYFIPMNLIPVDQVDAFAESVKNKAKTANNEDKTVKTPGIIEKRAKGIIIVRNRLRNRYYDLFRDIADQIVTREHNQITRYAQKYLGGNDVSSFDAWINDYYQNTFPDFISRKMKPIIRTYTSAVGDVAAQEIDLDVDDLADMDEFVSGYVDVYATRHIESSVGQLRSLIKEDVEDKLDEISTRADEWLERRPDKIALNETVRAESAAAATIFLASGYRLRWQIQGATTCPYCKSLNGMIVGGNEFFVNGGNEVQPEGQEPMMVRYNTRHAPLHASCDCIIVAA